MNPELPFREIGSYPDEVNATTIIIRLLDGLGYRFYWATEGLTESDYSFRAAVEAMSIYEIIRHIWGLVNWIGLSMGLEMVSRPREAEGIRASILQNLMTIRLTFTGMKKSELVKISIDKRPFWHIINGPISDALTHVGQINILRRAVGNPAPEHQHFLGFPPEII